MSPTTATPADAALAQAGDEWKGTLTLGTGVETLVVAALAWLAA